MKWKHNFYQNDITRPSYDFYHYQRPAEVILEMVCKVKKGLYKAKVIEIKSNEEFRIMGQAGGCSYQYKIDEEFLLRQHKNKKDRNGWNDHHHSFWFCPIYRDTPQGERYVLIEK